jgi:FAD/FMN-containing dehydrogenase
MSFLNNPPWLELTSIFKGDLARPGEPKYEKHIKRWSVLAERPAAIIALVKDEQDVAAAVKFAVKEGMDIAIKGESTHL